MASRAKLKVLSILNYCAFNGGIQTIRVYLCFCSLGVPFVAAPLANIKAYGEDEDFSSFI
jgi:hypothetical protein